MIVAHPKYFARLLAYLLLLFPLIMSCNQTSGDESTDQTAALSSTIKVALLLPRWINEKAWSYYAYEGLQKCRWEGKQYKFGLQENAQGLTPFHDLLSDEEEAIVDSVKNGIISGKIDIMP